MTRTPARRRQGVATLMALMIISLTLGVCYTMLRVQTNSRLLQHNADRLSDVRRAAVSGLHAGLSAMHAASWSGADTSETVYVDDDTWYRVEYLTGDASLPASDWRRPYRVTIRSTGRGSRPAGPDLQAVAEAVVQLTPRGVAAEPGGWSQLQGATALHWDDAAPLRLELPCRIDGMLRSQGPVELARNAPPDTNLPFRGRIDEVALWSRAIGSVDVLADYLDCTSGSLPSAYSSRGPDSWWRLNESSGAATAANQGFGPAGSYEGPTLQQPGAPGESGNVAADFDGHNDNVFAGDEGGWPDLTIYAWIYDEGPGDTSESVIAARAADLQDDSQSWSLSLVEDGGGIRRPRFRVRTAAGTQSLTATTVSIAPATWYFVAATYDQTTLKLHVDGVLAASAAAAGPIDHPADAVTMIGDLPPGNLRAAYLRGLDDGVNDYRTLTGPVETPLAGLSSEDEDLITGSLGPAVGDLPTPGAEPAAFPALPVSYQLYPGGKTYYAGAIGSFASNAQFLPSPLANPLGLVTASGSVEFGSYVTFRGVLVIQSGDLRLNGSDISLLPTPLPQLEGGPARLQLPVAAVQNKLTVENPTQASVQGLVICWDELQLKPGSGTAVTIQGAAAAPRLDLRKRTDWPTSASWWVPKLTQWRLDEIDAVGLETFPFFLDSSHGLSPEPALTIEPDPRPASYHWHDWLGPLFVPGAGDAHLRWQVVRWQENGA